MNRLSAQESVMGATYGLAIHANDLPSGDLGHSLNPGQKTVLGLLGIPAGKDAPERIVRGSAMRQVQKTLQPLDFGIAELLDLHPIIGPTDHATDRNDDDIHERVPKCGPASWVFEVDKTIQHTRDRI